ncbi:MAG: 2-oxoacid:acceptor oxidoreductase subunit alpha [Candidatus Aminicenantes bacterium]|nr:2-oxoacid:acceptor oxidoreductase subunit alpha [Candidatus Aminicenantes bacterium]
MIVLGGLGCVFGLDRGVIDDVLAGTARGAKGREAVEANLKAVSLGFEAASRLVPPDKRLPIERLPDEGRLLLSGDEAMAFGALAAGCRFFAAYPICPASEVWQWLVGRFPGFDGLLVQTEDEPAALNMALGAALAGARSMTSTSGPGGALMMEAFSLAGMAEIPVVISHVQRVGPGTGIPTKTEQSDLLLWVFGSHGDFPRIVLAPGSLEECFDLTVKAFNLAERFQCPVVVLTEQDMGQNLRTCSRFNLRAVTVDRGRLAGPEDLGGGEDFKRYAFTADGISPRSFPSQKGGRHMVEGNEHDETGFRDETEENRARMAEKRARKLLSASAEDFVPGCVWGPETARLGLVLTGSVLGAALESLEGLRALGLEAKILQIRTLWPFPAEEVRSFLSGCDEAYVVENNFGGQLRNLIRSRDASPRALGSVLKYSGQAFQPSDIVRGVTKLRR